jgi:hypothetical protein
VCIGHNRCHTLSKSTDPILVHNLGTTTKQNQTYNRTSIQEPSISEKGPLKSVIDIDEKLMEIVSDLTGAKTEQKRARSLSKKFIITQVLVSLVMVGIPALFISRYVFMFLVCFIDHI